MSAPMPFVVLVIDDVDVDDVMAPLTVLFGDCDVNDTRKSSKHCVFGRVELIYLSL